MGNNEIIKNGRGKIARDYRENGAVEPVRIKKSLFGGNGTLYLTTTG